MSVVSVPTRVIGREEGAIAYVSAPAGPVEPSGDFGCPACARLGELLEAHGGDAAELPRPARSRPRIYGLERPNAEYEAFVADDAVRVRYLLQAHLYWFGYYPELMLPRATPPGRSTPVDHARRTGFPGSPVDGQWGGWSRNAYAAFLADAEGPTGWTREEDVVRAADVRLVQARCAEGFTRPGFDYYRDYRVRKPRSGGADVVAVRPFLLRTQNLEAGPDPLLRERVEAEADVEPASRLRCLGRTVIAKSAPAELPADAVWPVRPTCAEEPTAAEAAALLPDDALPEGLAAAGRTAADVRRDYPLYRYNRQRWVVSYATEDGRTLGAYGRAFHAHRRPDRMHAGIDLYADYGDPVVAVTDGLITGLDRAAPISTCFLFVYHEALGITINYGEVHHESLMRLGLMVGDTVRAGQVIGAVGRMSCNERHRGSMLHVDAYRGRQSRWFGVRPPTRPRNRLDPTRLLLALRAREAERRGG